MAEVLEEKHRTVLLSVPASGGDIGSPFTRTMHRCSHTHAHLHTHIHRKSCKNKPSDVCYASRGETRKGPGQHPI